MKLINKSTTSIDAIFADNKVLWLEFPNGEVPNELITAEYDNTTIDQFVDDINGDGRLELEMHVNIYALDNNLNKFIAATTGEQ